MNLVETWITKIHSVKKLTDPDLKFDLWEVVADTDCYGCKEEKKVLHLFRSEIRMIHDKGYYLT